MRKIALLGAGRSASSLIKYLVDNAISEDLFITIADREIGHISDIVGNSERVEEVVFDVFEDKARIKMVQDSDLIISMLPARFHIVVAKDCVKYKKNMVTASYITEDMRALD